MCNQVVNYSNENPCFFLFTCVKNGRKYIEKLFESLLEQTKVNFVHYIYEDGSDDPIEDLVEKYKEKSSKLDNPITIIYEKNPINIGLNMSTQHCINKCFCDYFIWIDCDNFIDKDFFLELEKVVVCKKPDVLRSHTLRGHDDVYLDVLKNKMFKRSLEKKYIKPLFFVDRIYYYSFFAVNYETWKKSNPPSILNQKDLFNDTQVLSWCLLNNFHMNYCKKAIGYYVERNDSEAVVFSNFNNLLNNFKMMYSSYPIFCQEICDYFIIYQMYKDINVLIWNKSRKEAKKLFKERSNICKKYKTTNRLSWADTRWFRLLCKLYVPIVYSIYKK